MRLSRVPAQLEEAQTYRAQKYSSGIPLAEPIATAVKPWGS